MNDQFRHAIERGDFARAAALWREWACKAAESRDPIEWAELANAYRWGREALLCARAQLQDQSNRLGTARAYTIYS